MELRVITRDPSDPLYDDEPCTPATPAEVEATLAWLRAQARTNPFLGERYARHGEAWLRALATSCPKLASSRPPPLPGSEDGAP